MTVDYDWTEGAKTFFISHPLIATFAIFILLFGIFLTAIAAGGPKPRTPAQIVKKLKFRRKSYADQIQEDGYFSKLQAHWVILKNRIRNFYIETLLVPNYREEWKKYNHWIYRSAERPVGFSKKKRFMFRRTRFHHIKKSFFQQSDYDFSTFDSKDKAPMLPHTSHDHELCQTVLFNVSGLKIKVQQRALCNFPDSLLGNSIRRMKFYDPIKDEYFFDRSRPCFESIVFFYQSGGQLKKPTFVPAQVFLFELIFFDIGDDYIKKFSDEEGLANEDEDLPLESSSLREKIWLLFEYPESSRQAKVLAFISVLVIFLSTTVFILETMDPFKTKNDDEFAEDNNSKGIQINPFFFTETICVVWFTIEIIMRAIASPDIKGFLKDFLNIVDFVSIIPYYFSLLLRLASNKKKGAAPFAIIRIVRLVRVFRIFKLSRHSNGLKILGKTLKASLNELGLLIFFLIIGVILFSAVLYFVEDKLFSSVPDGFWWAVVTMTTVGYGDVVPKGVWGKIFGSFCAITGVLTIALPVPVIVSNFNYFYHRENVHETVNMNVLHHVECCPYLPGLIEEYDEEFTKMMEKEKEEFSRMTNYRRPSFIPTHVPKTRTIRMSIKSNNRKHFT